MKNKLLRNRLIKILAKESPLTTQEIKDKLIDKIANAEEKIKVLQQFKL